MIAGKRIDRAVIIAVIAAILLSLGAILWAPRLAENADPGVHMEYEERIFDTSAPVVIDIRMDPDEWQSMLDTATAEVYHECDVVIDGTKFSCVGIRPKGNTSLSSIAMNPDTERFSFKLEFDQFVDGQTAWGLDKLCLNNNYADATNMKEALIYDMYKYMDADASLYNTAEIYVNGEYWGVYLALEAVEDSFMLRNYGVVRGNLYKPDSMGMSFGGWDDESSRRSRRASDEPDESEPTPTPEPTPVPTAKPDPMPPAGALSESMQAIVDAREEEESSASGEASGSFDFPDFGGGPFGGGGGQNLNYIDDDLDSYSTIWGCEVTRTNDADHRRVVEALKHNSEQTDIEKYMDVDSLLRYMVVHTFSVNGDSLTGGMAHNYYLYECGGRLAVLPWDYNLSLGGMGMGGSDPKSVVNDPIDDSWQSTDFFDFILDNEEYLARYHELYRELVEGYIYGGKLDEFYTRMRTQLDDLVTADPNALYDYDEYDAGAETLYQLVKLRGESVLGQLNGTIPSTSAGQKEDSSSLIEAPDIDLSVMGTMSMGGSFGGGGGFPGGFNPFRRGSNEPSGETASDETASGETASGEAASDETASDEPASDETASGEEGESTSRRSRSASGEMQTQKPDAKTVATLAVCAVVLAGGIVFAARFRKKG